MPQVILIVLDGFGIGQPYEGNAVLKAQKPTFDELEKWYPKTILQASGIHVGLLWNQEGNSEAGHLTIGAGRAIYNYLPQIIFSLQDGTFFTNPAFLGAINHVKKYKSRLHLMGLVSSGTVHSYIDHLYGLFNLIKKESIPQTYLHIFTDGRDAPLKEAKKFISNIKERLVNIYPMIKVATIMGRFFAMDRNANWERTIKAYRCLTSGEGVKIKDEIEYLEDSYQKSLTDEFIEPAILETDGLIKNNDAVIFFNFREDSARQLTEIFLLPSFTPVKNIETLKNIFFVTMTEYEEHYPANVAFKPQKPLRTLARTLAEANKSQLHMAETEKYAHVTYFFNGFEEKILPNEKRILVQSLMGASLITEHVVKAVESEQYDFIIANYANADMVGHSGNFDATVQAVEILDSSLKQIKEAILEKDAVLIITSDHGSAEEKIDIQTGEIKTRHSQNPVPFYLIAKKYKNKNPNLVYLYDYKETGGFLYDIAPTILEIMGIAQPLEMTGQSLLKTLIK